MDNLKKPLSIKIIYWFTNITFWIYISVSVVTFAFVAALFIFNTETLELHVGVPVVVNILETGTLDLNIVSNYVDVEFVEMTGKVHFHKTPPEVAKVYALFIFIIFILSIYIFVIFRRFINNVYSGNYFDYKNISLLKRISYTLVIIWLFTVFYGYFQYFFLVINMKFNTIELTSDVKTYPIILLVALIIWVLSHIFAVGSKLEEENKLIV